MSKPKKIKNKKRPRPVEYHLCNGSLGFDYVFNQQNISVHLHSRFKGEDHLEPLYVLNKHYTLQYKASNRENEAETQFLVDIKLRDDFSIELLEEIELQVQVEHEVDISETLGGTQNYEDIFFIIKQKLESIPSIHRLLKQIDQEALEEPLQDEAENVLQLSTLLTLSNQQLKNIKSFGGIK